MANHSTELNLSADIIDVRDIIARVEELESEAENFRSDEPADDTIENANAAWAASDEGQELASLTAVLADLKSTGGDEQWRGAWYPGTLIRDSHFQEFARDLAEDLGSIPPALAWPCSCIDWGQAARELRMDYSSCEIDGTTYWFR